MKTALGRVWDRTIRLHVAECPICREKLTRMEDSLFQEAMGEERHDFGLFPQAGPESAPSSRRGKRKETPARKKSKAR